MKQHPKTLNIRTDSKDGQALHKMLDDLSTVYGGASKATIIRMLVKREHDQQVKS